MPAGGAVGQRPERAPVRGLHRPDKRNKSVVMPRYFSVIVIFGILLVGGGYVMIQKSDEAARKRRADELESVRRAFAEKARAAAREDDDLAYLRDARAALRAYDEELKKKVYGSAPEARDPAEKLKLKEEKLKKKEITEQSEKAFAEGYAICKDAYDTLMAGNWKPVLTAKGKEDTRLDLYDVAQVKDDEGNPVLQAKFFFWGVDAGTRMSWGKLALRYWKEEQGQGKDAGKTVEKVHGKADGDAQPHIYLDNPSNFIAEFPAGVAIGYLWLPPMPHEAKAVDIELTYGAHQGGKNGEADSVLKWEKLPIPEAWKLPEGSWKAESIEATDDEIAGKDANAEDGAADKGGKHRKARR